MSELACLLPVPRGREWTGGEFGPGAGGVRVVGEHPVAAAWACEALAERGGAWAVADEGPVSLVVDGELGAEAYRLTVTAEAIELVGGDAAGLLYGAATLAQLCAGGGPLPCQRIVDRPVLRERGVMLDISRDRVPTMETLFDLVDALARWKVNQLQLYCEHTFAYAGHEEVWAEASPLTGDEVRALDDFCAARHVDLVPCTNTLGHMERWLKHERYRPLAECPGGFVDPWGNRRDVGSTLCPTDPGSWSLVSGLLAELLPHFRSAEVNVGGDEPFELGQGRCAGMDTRALYLEWLHRLRDAVAPRRMRCWGDVLLEAPGDGGLPDGVVVLAWGYEPDHPFDRDARRLAASGVPFVLAPGTSTWNAICGRTDVMRANLASAATAAAKHGALGLLNTDWGDAGHWQHPAFSWPGFALGAALAWNPDAPPELDAALDRTFFRVPGMAARIAELGRVSPLTGAAPPNAAFLCQLMQKPDMALPDDVTADGVAAALARLDELLDGADDDEVTAGGRLLRHGALLARARLGGPIAGFDAATRRALDEDLALRIDEQRAFWLACARPGGLADSVGRLEALRARYAVADGGERSSR